MTGTARIAAIILTKNEEQDLPACLESLDGVATQIFVVDSGSTDRTVEIAERHGAQVLTHKFVSHAAQFNWALDRINTSAEWLLRIDADERLSDDLQKEIRERLSGVGEDVTGFLVPRRIRFLGRTIQHGDSYPVWLLRLWRNGFGRCEDTWMDEHVVLSSGRTAKLCGDLIHDIPKNLSEWTRKHNGYADRECKDILATAANAADGYQAGMKKLKKTLFLRLPPFYRAFLYWAYRYFLRLGFLDGKEGLIYHFLQAFWYRFLVDAKLFEMQKQQKEVAAHAEAQFDGAVVSHAIRAE